MFCSNCGYENKEDSQFCEKCGYTLKTENPSQSSTPSTTTYRKLISIGSIIIFICFFLPWVAVSCRNNSTVVVRASGLELATGNYSFSYALDYSIGSLYEENQIPNEGKFPAVFLLLLIGLLGLFSLNGKQSSSIIAIVAGIAGIIGLLILISNFSQIEQGGMLKVNYEIGFIGQWIGNIWNIAFGLISRKE